MKIIHTILLLLISYIATAQGQIAGIVLDEKKQPIIGAAVQVTQGGIQKGGASTGIDGEYLIMPLDTGVYRMIVTYPGYDSFFVNKLTVNRRIEQNVTLFPKPDYCVRGTITAAQGEIMAGAVVQLYHGTSLVEKCQTETDGSFYLRIYKIGTRPIWPKGCTMKISHSGYKTVRRKVSLSRHFTSQENFTLRRKWWQSKK